MKSVKLASKGSGLVEALLSIPTFFTLAKFFIEGFGPLGKWAALGTYIFVPMLVGIGIFLFIAPAVNVVSPTFIGLFFLVGGGFFAQHMVYKGVRDTSTFKPKVFVANTPVNDPSDHTLPEMIVKGPSAFIGGSEGSVYKETLRLLIRKSDRKTLNREYKGMSPMFLAITSDNMDAFDMLMASNKVNEMQTCYLPECSEPFARKLVAVIPHAHIFFRTTALELAIKRGNKKVISKLLPLYKNAGYSFRKSSQIKPLQALGFDTKGLKIREDIRKERIKKVKERYKKSKATTVNFFVKVKNFFVWLWAAIAEFWQGILTPKHPHKL